MLQSVQFSSSVVSDSDPMDCSTPGFPVHHQSQSLRKLTSIESVIPSNHLILCHPLVLPPSIFPSIRVFSNESVLHIRWPKYWSFNFSISPSNEHPGLISIGVSTSASVLLMNTQDWFPLGWTGWISLQSKGLSRVFSNTTAQKHQFFSIQLSSQSNLTSIHDHWKNNSLD